VAFSPDGTKILVGVAVKREGPGLLEANIGEVSTKMPLILFGLRKETDYEHEC